MCFVVLCSMTWYIFWAVDGIFDATVLQGPHLHAGGTASFGMADISLPSPSQSQCWEWLGRTRRGGQHWDWKGEREGEEGRGQGCHTLKSLPRNQSIKWIQNQTVASIIPSTVLNGLRFSSKTCEHHVVWAIAVRWGRTLRGPLLNNY